MFRAIFQGPHGPTVTAADPKLDAYKQAAYIQNVLGRRYRLTCHTDGAYTVAGDGLGGAGMGKVLAADVGKCCFLRDGVFQIENAKQRAARQKKKTCKPA